MKRFFLKKEAKTSAPGVRLASTRTPHNQSFLVLFFKKEPLSFGLGPH
jgi:hypothetical protein